MPDVAPKRSPLRSTGVQVTLGLVAGLALGMLLSRETSPSAFTTSLMPVLDVVGTAWINAVRMTVIPLVVPLLIVGVAGGEDLRATGTVGAQAFGWMLLLLVACAALSTLVSPVWFETLTLDADATARLRATAKIDVPSADALSVRTFILSLIPLNPIKAAADGTLLPVVLFTLLYAFALGQVSDGPRLAQLSFWRGMADTMLVVVRWMLALGGIGIFALAAVLGQKLGTNVLGAIGFYFMVNIVLHLIAVAGIYVVIAVTGRVPVRQFARALVPASVVGMGTRSSLASLPAMVKGATDVLQLPPTATGFVLPLCASVFKLTSAIYWPVGALFIAKLYGIDLSTANLLLVAASSIVLNFSTPGIPSGGMLLQVPLYASIGLPVEGIGILIALDTLPDMFKTLLNVTSDMMVAVMTTADGRAGGAPVG
ncbi:dicarboxylate/amino acid:cation symporter [Gemmatimonas sp.]|uniref:dicarboxylate/amino acid:cation symporter n=1 Tax=Gemmatimonas sp. TaxID=1962908 RepID=UPI0022C395C7|nr:dicarboxylate/amino acid:cation symporter [Gemmatimonas sp.]MCZ8204884.1 dicarboxylate/amino acid:cation symporter [Gemmatimonas sp.]